jgi:hypothetical protein
MENVLNSLLFELYTMNSLLFHIRIPDFSYLFVSAHILLMVSHTSLLYQIKKLRRSLI